MISYKKLKDTLGDELGPTVEMVGSPNRCFECNELLDAATPVGERAVPKKDDVTMCVYCGHLMAFTADQTLRELEEAERAEMEKMPEIQTLIEARKCQMN